MSFKSSNRIMQHPVPQNFLTYIGDMVVSFNNCLELSVKTLIQSLILEHQRIGQIITTELPFKTLRSVALALYHERHGEDEDYKVLKNLMKKCGEIEEKRNKIIHSFWGANAKPNCISNIKSTVKQKKGRINFNCSDMSENDLSEFVNEIKQKANEILEFYFYLMRNEKVINNPSEKIW